MNSIIRNFIAKRMFQQKGAIANNKSVEFSVNALQQRLKNLGVDPNTIKSEGELNQILSFVKQAEDQAFNQKFGNVLSGNKFQKKAEVVDLKNKKLDPEKPILGGTQETDEQILKRLNKDNEDSINRLKNKKDPPEELAGGGVAGLLGETPGYIKGLKVQGSGTMSGKQGIYSTGEKSTIKLPEGITSNKSFINLIANLDIPISEKISLLGDVQYNKFRNKIEKGDEELFVEDPASSIDRKIGIGFDTGTGITGSAKYGIDDKGFMFKINKSFAEGGRTGFRGGGMDMGNASNQAQSASMGGGGGGSGGGGGNARENYRTQQYNKPKTKTTRGGGGGGKPTPKTNIITKSGKDLAALFNIPVQFTQGVFGDPRNRKGGFLTKAGLTKGQIENLEEDANAIGGLKGSITNTTYGSPNNTFGFHENMDLTDFANSATFGQGNFTTDPTTGKKSFDGGNYDFDGKFGKVGDFIDAGGLMGVANKFGESLYEDQIKNPEMNYLAQGGPARQNFKMGKRAFLKFLASGAAGIAGLKSGLLGFGKGATKKAVTETVKSAGSGTPPPYFFKLVEKIKTLGDDVTVGSSTMPRTKVTKYKDYELTESLDGSKQIQKIGKEDDMITQSEYMTYTKGQADETTKGKKVADDYEEVTETNSRIYKDNFNDPDYEDGINLKEILKEVGEPEIKKADGGRIGYAVGKKVIGEGIMAGINKLFGKGTMTTADKLKRPQKALNREMFKNFDDRNPEMQTLRDGKTKSIIPKDEYAEYSKDFDKEILNIPVQQEGKFTKAEYLIQRLENTIKGNPNDKYVQETFPNFIKELKDNPELAKNENVFKELGGDLPKGQQIVVYGDDSIDFFTQKSGPKNIDRIKKIMSKYNISKDKALKIMKMEPNDQVMEFKMLEIANRKLNATGGLANMLGE